MSDKEDYDSEYEDDDSGDEIDEAVVLEDSDDESGSESSDDDADSEESEEEDEHEVTRNMLVDTYHPECKIPDIISIQNATRVIHNPKGHISDDNHTTTPILTKFERAKVIGFRAQQIAYGARPMVAVPPHITDVIEIAELELKEKKLPFIIRRPMPDGSSEYWKLRDLII